MTRGAYLIDDSFKAKIKKIVVDIKNQKFHTELVDELKKSNDGTRLKNKIFNCKDFNDIEKNLLIKFLNSRD